MSREFTFDEKCDWIWRMFMDGMFNHENRKLLDLVAPRLAELHNMREDDVRARIDYAASITHGPIDPR